MTADYASWRRERLAELDLIDAQIRELPEYIGDGPRIHLDAIRKWLESEWQVDDRLQPELRRWSAELARITVAPASDGEVKS